MTSQTNCPFCKRITAGEYDQRDDYCVSFPPLNPVVPGHMLVVPRKHVSSAFSNPRLAGRALECAGYLANRMGLGAANFITSAGADATQTVFHLHVHVVPRTAGDGLPLPWTPQQALSGKADAVTAAARAVHARVCDPHAGHEREPDDTGYGFNCLVCSTDDETVPWLRREPDDDMDRACAEAALTAALPLLDAEGRASTDRILRAFTFATLDPDISPEAGDRIRRAFGRALQEQLDNADA